MPENKMKMMLITMEISEVLSQYNLSPTEKIELFTKLIEVQVKNIDTFYDLSEKSEEDKEKAVKGVIDELLDCMKGGDHGAQ